MSCFVSVAVKSKSATLSHSASSAAVFCRKVSHSLALLAMMLLTRYVLKRGVITGISAVVTVLCIWSCWTECDDPAVEVGVPVNRHITPFFP